MVQIAMDSNPAEAAAEHGGCGVKSKVGERKCGCRASSAASCRVAATTGTRAVATQTGTPAEAKEPKACADEVDLTSLPDDAFAVVLTAIDQPQAAARMLAACRRVRVAVPVPPDSASVGPNAPMVVQVQAMPAFLRSPVAKLHRLGSGRPGPGGGGLELAATHGWVHLLPGLVEHGERWSDETRLQAVRHNQFKVVEWGCLHAPAFSWGSTCSDAAGAGHLELLQWARAQSRPAPWDETTCSAAAYGGHLELLQWARSQTPPASWDERTCGAAARGGHLELLQWARAQTPPAPWNAWT